MDRATISGTPRTGWLNRARPPISRLMITKSTKTQTVPILFMIDMIEPKVKRRRIGSCFDVFVDDSGKFCLPAIVISKLEIRIERINGNFSACVKIP